MKKNLIRIMGLLFYAIAFIFVSTTIVKAQTLKIKVGDRVEINGISPYKGIITAIGDGNEHDKSCYRVKSDSDKDLSSQGNWTCSWGVKDFIFLLDAHNNRIGDVYGKKTNQSNTDNNQTIKASNGNQTKQNQNNTDAYKVGDRVEILVGSKWFPATVVRGLEHNSYGVQQDQWIGKGVYDKNIKPYDSPTPSELRLLNDGSKAPVAKKMPLMRKPVKCPVQPNAKGGAPSLELVIQLMQCTWEEQSTQSNIVNFDVHRVQIGTPRKWVTKWDGGDMGDGVPGETIVYPVTGTWTKKIFAADGSSVIITEEKGTHKFYINSFHKWVCGYESSTPTAPMEAIYK